MTGLLFLSLLALAEPEPEPVLVDRIVAVVGDRLVLASEIELETELAARNVYTVSALEDRRHDARQWLVDMAIIRGLAADVRVYEPTPQEVQEAVDRFRATFADSAAYRQLLDKFGVSDARLQSLVTTRLVVEHYIQRNVGLGLTDEQLVLRYGEWMTERRQQVSIREIAERGE